MYRVKIWLEDRVETQFAQNEKYAQMKQRRAEAAGHKCEVMDCEHFKTAMNDKMSETVTRVAKGMSTQADADVVTALFHRLNDELPDEMKFLDNEGD